MDNRFSNPKRLDQIADEFYRQANESRPPTDVWHHVVEHAATIHASIRVQAYASAIDRLAIMFYWLTVFTKRLSELADYRVGSSIENIILKKYPRVCYYCTNPVCICAIAPLQGPSIESPYDYRRIQEASMRRSIKRAQLSVAEREPRTLSDFADMFKAIFGGVIFHQSIDQVAARLQEEVGEVSGVVLLRYSFPSEVAAEIEGALADVYSWLFSLYWKLDHVLGAAASYSPPRLRSKGSPTIGLDIEEIIYMPALTNYRPSFHSCFISHSDKDQEFVRVLHDDLEAAGVDCWFTAEDLQIGARKRASLDKSIRAHDKLLLVLSANSIVCDNVEKEVETAVEREREENWDMLFPIRLDDAVMSVSHGWPADVRRLRHIGDFRHWANPGEYQKALSRLLRDLKAAPAARPHVG